MRKSIFGYAVVIHATKDYPNHQMPNFYRLLSALGFLVWSRDWRSVPIFGSNVQHCMTTYRLGSFREQIEYIRTRGERKKMTEEVLRRLEAGQHVESRNAA